VPRKTTLNSLAKKDANMKNLSIHMAALCSLLLFGNSASAQTDDYILPNTPVGMTGSFNTGLGDSSLNDITSGEANSAIGYGAGYEITTGNGNTATGYDALYGNSPETGGYNTASGYLAMFVNTTGSNNAALGANALSGNTTGNSNTACGYNALVNSTTGSFNVAVGAGAGSNITIGSYNIMIGSTGANDADTIRIGTEGTQDQTFIAGISGATVAAGAEVYVASDGQLGTITSSARFKKDIRSIDDASSVILSLRPVTFHYKPELDSHGTPQFGLVAEEVEKVDPDLVARDNKNQVYTVRYQAVSAMLLNEFIKQHNTVEEQRNEITVLKAKAAQKDQRLHQLEQTVRSLVQD
jgi:hypothetical protein